MSGETVVVACKFQPGIILRTFEMIDKWDDGGKRMIKEARPRPEMFTIKGTGIPKKTSREHQAQIVGGYAITQNVPANLWKTWAEDNKDSDLVKNQVIFAGDKLIDVEAKARNNAKIRSGLEPLNPDKIIRNGQRVPADPRIPHVIDPNDGPMA